LVKLLATLATWNMPFCTPSVSPQAVGVKSQDRRSSSWRVEVEGREAAAGDERGGGWGQGGYPRVTGVVWCVVK